MQKCHILLDRSSHDKYKIVMVMRARLTGLRVLTSPRLILMPNLTSFLEQGNGEKSDICKSQIH